MQALIILLFFYHCILAETHLSGNIGGMTFEQTGNPFIISDNITIQEGSGVTIKQGCVFLFKNFCGMVVAGELIIEGTLENPVVFTTVNDSQYCPYATQLANPFDWNGILIKQQAEKVSMSNFILAYSVYGIKSEKDAFRLENGTFKANGQFHLTVKDTVKPVVDNYPYSYGKVFSSKISDKHKVRTRNALTHKAVPVLIGVASIGAGAMCGVFAYRVHDTKSLFDKERDAGVRAVLERQGKTELAASISAGGVCAITIPISLVLFIKNNRKPSVAAAVFIMSAISNETMSITAKSVF